MPGNSAALRTAVRENRHSFQKGLETMKTRKTAFLLRSLFTAALIAAMLAVSGGAVSAEPANDHASPDTVCRETTDTTIILEGIRVDGMLYPEASAVEYKGSYFSELEGDDIAVMIYNALYEHSVTSPDNDNIPLTLDPPYMSGDGTDFKATKESFKESFRTGAIAFLYDHPEAYWVDFPQYTLTASSSGGSYGIDSVEIEKVAFFDGAFEQRETIATGIDAAVSRIAAGETRYDTVKNIHDYICNHSTYDFDELEHQNKPQSHTAAPLFDGTDATYVCEGYAKAFKVLCDRFGIPCALVSGTGVTSSGEESHMWNHVQMDDGLWYGVDVTWDDQDYGIIDNYFLKGKGSFETQHKPKKPGGSESNGDKFEFNLYYPGLTTPDYDPDWNQTSSEPVASQPVASEPVTSQPVASEPVTSQPVASEPVTSQPVASEPVTSQPVTSEPVTSQPVASEPVTSQPVASEPVTSQPVASEPVTSQPVASEPVTSQPVTSDTSSDTTSSDDQPKMVALRLEDPDNGFVRSAQIPETAKAKAGDSDVEPDKINVVVSKIDATKKKSLTDGIKTVNSGFDPDDCVFEAYDIKLKDSSGNTVTLTEGKVRICLAFPSGLTKKYNQYVYSVYHQKDDGSVERVKPVSYNSYGVWFEASNFSAYGLAALEKSGGEEPSPGTGETIFFTVLAAVLLVLAAGAIAFVIIRGRSAGDKDESQDNPDKQL